MSLVNNILSLALSTTVFTHDGDTQIPMVETTSLREDVVLFIDQAVLNLHMYNIQITDIQKSHLENMAYLSSFDNICFSYGYSYGKISNHEMIDDMKKMGMDQDYAEEIMQNLVKNASIHEKSALQYWFESEKITYTEQQDIIKEYCHSNYWTYYLILNDSKKLLAKEVTGP